MGGQARAGVESIPLAAVLIAYDVVSGPGGASPLLRMDSCVLVGLVILDFSD